ncbi:hypothetical protein EJ73_02381 [Hoylesella shahii DSM 15611 = JCM 12083]|uniref:Uncharacterized protein n=1 Tax=Hoylesella shahii DSM 15611 = JCM 12083 TaxID=1122991 RepID=A0A318HV94_9BACT|nr:hypothetical protein EJ73_02381 [Hoylesella shahii DSM 15611 = JCM 12083]
MNKANSNANHAGCIAFLIINNNESLVKNAINHANLYANLYKISNFAV